jgi:hypothetical protein
MKHRTFLMAISSEIKRELTKNRVMTQKTLSIGTVIQACRVIGLQGRVELDIAAG